MEWVKKIRIEKGFAQQDVANAAGVARGAYANIENGSRRPSVDMAKKIAAVLGFDWTKFFE